MKKYTIEIEDFNTMEDDSEQTLIRKEFEDLEDIKARWARYSETNELDWWLPKSPNFYMGVNYED